jgi:hypothetical protein
MVPRRRLRRGPDHPACVVASTPYRLPASSPRRRFIETRLRRPVVLSPRRRSRPFWPASRAAGCRERRVTSLDSARLRGDHPGKAPAASQKQGQRIAESHATSDILAGRCPQVMATGRPPVGWPRHIGYPRRRPGRPAPRPVRAGRALEACWRSSRLPKPNGSPAQLNIVSRSVAVLSQAGEMACAERTRHGRRPAQAAVGRGRRPGPSTLVAFHGPGPG